MKCPKCGKEISTVRVVKTVSFTRSLIKELEDYTENTDDNSCENTDAILEKMLDDDLEKEIYQEEEENNFCDYDLRCPKCGNVLTSD